MKTVPVLLAGGIGERFWPLSRSAMPKQLLAVTGRRSMLEETLSRTTSLCRDGVRPLLVTSRAIAPRIRKTIGRRLAYDMIVEPVGRNTAPAVAAAAAWVRRAHGDAVMLVLSSDHAITPVGAFIASVRYAARLAERRNDLVVFGITPTRPETGYGYIQVGARIASRGSVEGHVVRRFVEKPTAAKARAFVKSGSYLWNSGMFVWKASVIEEELAAFMPDLSRHRRELVRGMITRRAIDRFYRRCAGESIDYGVMERSHRVAVVKGTFSWDDIGSWESMTRIHPVTAAGNAVVGPGLYQADCTSSILVNRSKLNVAALGLSGVVLVATDDALLVVDRARLPQLKKYLGDMKSSGDLPNRLF